MNRITAGLSLIGFSVLIACVSSVPRGSSMPSSTHSNSNELEQKSRTSSEQVKFGAEEIIHHPVSIEDTVLQILRRDHRIKLLLAQGDAHNETLASWFTASEIALNEDDLPDLIVQGTEARLMGANLVPFWVLRKTHNGPVLVLRVDALGLEVLKTKTNTYRDIRASRATASEIITTTYTFDGSLYRTQTTVLEKITNRSSAESSSRWTTQTDAYSNASRGIRLVDFGKLHVSVVSEAFRATIRQKRADFAKWEF